MLHTISKYWDIYNENLRERYQIDEQGQKQGPYEAYHQNGQLAKHGSFKDGLEDGWFEERDETGFRKKLAQYKNGQLHGREAGFCQRLIISPNGQKQMGAFTNYDRHYVNGLLDGFFVTYDKKNRLIYNGNFKKGKEDGLQTFYKDGKLSKQYTAKAGEKDGLYLAHIKENEYIFGFYKEGKKNGTHAIISLDKFFMVVENYKEDKWHGRSSSIDINTGKRLSFTSYYEGKLLHPLEDRTQPMQDLKVSDSKLHHLYPEATKQITSFLQTTQTPMADKILRTFLMAQYRYDKASKQGAKLSATCLAKRTQKSSSEI